MTRLSLPAYGKINLYLKVLGRREDGYHEIESILQTITLHDRITLETRPEGISLEVDDPAIPNDASNLAWRAAASLPPAVRGPRGVHIRMSKSIPSGAGLGGGSSDAAATLVGLARMRGLAPSSSVLDHLAAGLGSDVPFFLTGGTATVTGRGTEVHPLQDLLGYELVLVFPGAVVSTREVYGRLSAPLTSSRRISRIRPFEPGQSASVRDRLVAWISVGNDLEPHACAICPAIGEIKERLLRLGAVAAAMSGSGSAVFGIYESAPAADRAAGEMERGGFRAARCAPLGRPEYRRSLGID